MPEISEISETPHNEVKPSSPGTSGDSHSFIYGVRDTTSSDNATQHTSECGRSYEDRLTAFNKYKDEVCELAKAGKKSGKIYLMPGNQILIKQRNSLILIKKRSKKKME